MNKTQLTEQEQKILTNLICFLFEHRRTITEIYDKVTMYDVVEYVSDNEKSEPQKPA